MTDARRLVALTAHRLGRARSETGLYLGVSEGAIRYLEHSAGPHVRVEANRMLSEMDADAARMGLRPLEATPAVLSGHGKA